jgi:2-polyprenyl-3-methyl-5-hydroxy-6-metoxy-1,4-benzoquinol methylase
MRNSCNNLAFIPDEQKAATHFKDHVLSFIKNNTSLNNGNTLNLYLIALTLMAQKNYKQARKILKKKLTNEQLKSIFLEMKKDTTNTQEIKNMLEFMEANNAFKENILNNPERTKQLTLLIQNLDISPKNAHKYKKEGYQTYYVDKKEDFSLESQKDWGEKQKNVYKILKEIQPKTVLDLGACTGWFSRLAEYFGAHVIATDIDEVSIEYQYNVAKNQNLNISPQFISFEESNSKEMKSDVVLCLALIHHLVLVSGITLEEILLKLSRLTKNTLILEFVAIDDPAVQVAVKNPTNFFNKKEMEKKFVNLLDTYAYKFYNTKHIKKISKKYFVNIKEFKSNNYTRKILILKKKS